MRSIPTAKALKLLKKFFGLRQLKYGKGGHSILMNDDGLKVQLVTRKRDQPLSYIRILAKTLAVQLKCNSNDVFALLVRGVA